MKELVGKLTAFDPEASRSLAIITYFDTLMDGRVSIETLLRGAATLSGVAAGYRRGAELVRVSAEGQRELPGSEMGSFECMPAGTGAWVWIERAGPPHASDAMIRERLAVAIAATTPGRPKESPLRLAVEDLMSPTLSDQERMDAAARLHLDPASEMRAVALPSHTQVDADWPTAILATKWGLVRGGIVPAGAAVRGTNTATGLSGSISALPDSWRTAVIALLLADGTVGPHRADEFGTLIHLAELVEHRDSIPPDVAQLSQIVGLSWSAASLQALADGMSVRAVAQAAGLHHSSVHAKLPQLTQVLGYDPRTPLGRTRLFSALMLHRVVHGHF